MSEAVVVDLETPFAGAILVAEFAALQSVLAHLVDCLFL